MATTKPAAKKGTGKKTEKKRSAGVKTVSARSNKEKEVKITIEVVIKNEAASAAPSFNLMALSDKAEIHPLLFGETDPEPNFEFKFTPTDGVKLTKIDIDGVIFSGAVLANASKIDSDGKLVVSVFADPMTTPIPMILAAVGEPNRSMAVTLKFNDKDVFKSSDNKKITIKDNRLGFLELPAVNLP